MGLFDGVRAYHAGWKFRRSILGQALAAHTQEYFYNGIALSHFSQEAKNRLIADFYSQLVAIQQSENSALECRRLLAEYVLSFCALNVLSLKETEKADQFYAPNPYISGTIWRHVERAVENVPEMAELKWANPDMSADDLIAYANTRSALMLYYANGLNMVRMAIGDEDRQKVWFRPFVEAMLVQEEDNQREKLGLPSLFDDVVRALPYSVYLDLVVKGARQPFYEWAKLWPDRYLAGEGPLPSMAKA